MWHTKSLLRQGQVLSNTGSTSQCASGYKKFWTQGCLSRWSSQGPACFWISSRTSNWHWEQIHFGIYTGQSCHYPRSLGCSGLETCLMKAHFIVLLEKSQLQWYSPIISATQKTEAWRIQSPSRLQSEFKASLGNLVGLYLKIKINGLKIGRAVAYTPWREAEGMAQCRVLA